MSTFLPFLVFEVLEGQIYYFLDKSIQKRMKGDLDKERMLQFFGLWIIWCNLSAHKHSNNLIYFGSVHRRREQFKVHIKYSFIPIRTIHTRPDSFMKEIPQRKPIPHRCLRAAIHVHKFESISSRMTNITLNQRWTNPLRARFKPGFVSY